MTGNTLNLSVLFLKEGDQWAAQCLEHDIAAQGKTLDAAKCALQKTLAGQGFIDMLHNISPYSEIKPAPDFYRAMFEKAEKIRYTFRVEFSAKDDRAAQADDVRVVLA